MRCITPSVQLRLLRHARVEMLHNHKVEQHRLFIERQSVVLQSRSQGFKAAPAAAPAVTEVADWEKYAPVNSGNKAIASKFIVAKMQR